jgi:hypothetical protein
MIGMESLIMTIGVFEMFSLVEWLIFGFIATNAALAGVCLLQSGVQRLGFPAKE